MNLSENTLGRCKFIRILNVINNQDFITYGTIIENRRVMACWWTVRSINLAATVASIECNAFRNFTTHTWGWETIWILIECTSVITIWFGVILARRGVIPVNFSPRSCWQCLQCSPRLPTFEGPTSKGKEREIKGRGKGVRRGEEGKGGGRKREGEGMVCPLKWRAGSTYVGWNMNADKKLFKMSLRTALSVS